MEPKPTRDGQFAADLSPMHRASWFQPGGFSPGLGGVAAVPPLPGHGGRRNGEGSSRYSAREATSTPSSSSAAAGSLVSFITGVMTIRCIAWVASLNSGDWLNGGSSPATEA